MSISKEISGELKKIRSERAAVKKERLQLKREREKILMARIPENKKMCAEAKSMNDTLRDFSTVLQTLKKEHIEKRKKMAILCVKIHLLRNQNKKLKAHTDDVNKSFIDLVDEYY